jgi:hypothetical protein
MTSERERDRGGRRKDEMTRMFQPQQSLQKLKSIESIYESLIEE